MKTKPSAKRRRKPQLPPETAICLTMIEKGRLALLQKLVLRRFKQPALLAQAVTHRSCHIAVGAKVIIQSNEKLEHFGDSVVQLGACRFLHKKYTDKNEHFLSQVLGKTVSNRTLAFIGEIIGLADFLIVERSADALRLSNRSKALADAMEAICAALFLDGGFPAVDKFLGKVLYPHAEDMAAEFEATGIITLPDERAVRLAKTKSKRQLLLERMIALKMGTPRYKHESEPGEPGNVCVATISDSERRVLGVARGATNKQALESAAGIALANLEEREPRSPQPMRLDPTVFDNLPTRLEPTEDIKTSR